MCVCVEEDYCKCASSVESEGVDEQVRKRLFYLFIFFRILSTCIHMHIQLCALFKGPCVCVCVRAYRSLTQGGLTCNTTSSILVG